MLSFMNSRKLSVAAALVGVAYGGWALTSEDAIPVDVDVTAAGTVRLDREQQPGASQRASGEAEQANKTSVPTPASLAAAALDMSADVVAGFPEYASKPWEELENAAKMDRFRSWPYDNAFDAWQAVKHTTDELARAPGQQVVDDVYMELVQWAWENGMFGSNNVYLAEFDGGIRGMAARRDIDAGEGIMSMPSSTWFSSWHFHHLYEDVLPNFDEVWNELTSEGQDQHALALALMGEQCKGDTSFWYPWLRQLPESCDITFTWTDEEIARLPNRYQASSRTGAKNLRNLYDSKIEPIFKANPEVFPAECFNREEFMRYECLTLSRTWTNHDVAGTRDPNRQVRFMVPVLELFNTANVTGVRSQFRTAPEDGPARQDQFWQAHLDGTVHRTKAQPEKREDKPKYLYTDQFSRAVLPTEVNIKRGQQVYIQYNNHAPAMAKLHGYGFYDPRFWAEEVVLKFAPSMESVFGKNKETDACKERAEVFHNAFTALGWDTRKLPGRANRNFGIASDLDFFNNEFMGMLRVDSWDQLAHYGSWLKRDDVESEQAKVQAMIETALEQHRTDNSTALLTKPMTVAVEAAAAARLFREVETSRKNNLNELIGEARAVLATPSPYRTYGSHRVDAARVVDYHYRLYRAMEETLLDCSARLRDLSQTNPGVSAEHLAEITCLKVNPRKKFLKHETELK